MDLVMGYRYVAMSTQLYKIKGANVNYIISRYELTKGYELWLMNR